MCFASHESKHSQKNIKSIRTVSLPGIEAVLSVLEKAGSLGLNKDNIRIIIWDDLKNVGAVSRLFRRKD